VRAVFSRSLNLKLIADDAPEAAPAALAPVEPPADEASSRALSNEEVQRFREVFGGEVRRVRNLKEHSQ
jgi:hypothetical protein